MYLLGLFQTFLRKVIELDITIIWVINKDFYVWQLNYFHPNFIEQLPVVIHRMRAIDVAYWRYWIFNSCFRKFTPEYHLQYATIYNKTTKKNYFNVNVGTWSRRFIFIVADLTECKANIADVFEASDGRIENLSITRKQIWQRIFILLLL